MPIVSIVSENDSSIIVLGLCRFLEIVKFIVREADSSMKSFLGDIIDFCGNVHPLLRQV